MDLLNLDELENLKELRNLGQTQDLTQLQNLKELRNLGNAQNLDKLQELRNLEDLRQLQHLHDLNQLRDLSQLQNIQGLNKLELLSNMQELQRLQQMDHLQQLQLLKRLGELEELNKLQNLQVLTNLNRLDNLSQLSQLNHMKGLDELPQLGKLQYIENLNRLQSLDKLEQLEVLNRLRVLDRLLDFNVHTLLYLSSFLVPGLVFQEAVSIFSAGRVGFKRSLVLMAIYNLLSILVCILLVYPHLSTPLLTQHPIIYYGIWLAVLLVLPFLLGWLIAKLANASYFGRFMKAVVSTTPTQAVASAWDRFLTEAESYRVVITLNNEEKIMGFFRRGMHTPQTTNPDDLYFTETSHYDPQASTWKDLEQPMGVWIKGREIKMVEVSPQS